MGGRPPALDDIERGVGVLQPPVLRIPVVVRDEGVRSRLHAVNPGVDGDGVERCRRRRESSATGEARRRHSVAFMWLVSA